MASTILPLPGGTGMMEISFLIMFGTSDLLGSSVIIGLLVWRIISYYLLIVHGFGQTVIDAIVDSAKAHKKRKEIKV